VRSSPPQFEEEGTAADNSAENALSRDALQQDNLGDDECIDVDAYESELGLVSNSSSESSSEDESQQCISSSEEIDTLSASDHEDETASGEQSVESMKPIAVQICMFLSFFQLCYRVSERGMSLLLSFLKTLLSWLGSYCPEIKTLHDVLPRNIYFMRKVLGRKSEIT
jgi:hypothetical protein